MSRSFFVSLGVVAALSACTHVQVRTAEHEVGIVQQGAPASARPHGRVSDHVVVVSIDGLRPDAIAKFHAATLQRLMAQGRYSLTAQTINTSLTLPSHTSMLTGVSEDVHGVTWNDDRDPNALTVPTVFGVARNAGFTTAAFFSKTKFHLLERPGTLDYSVSPNGGVGKFSGAFTVGQMEKYLAQADPNLVFVHLMEADMAGHTFGWMSSFYGQAVHDVDASMARLVRALDGKFGRGNYTLIVTADHGGHGKGHGTTMPLDMTIPWIAYGQGVERGGQLSGIHTMDTAATILWLLGVAEPNTWTGKPVTQAFGATFATR